MGDPYAVAWKEWSELVGQRGLRGKQGILLFIAVFGVVLPLQTGTSWITSPITSIAWAWVPMFLVVTVIADAIAGERERHTLDTLLASRLSDSSILAGKMGAAIVYAGCITAASTVAGLLTINIAFRQDGLLMYTPSTLLAMLVGGGLGAVLVAALGVLVSLRAPTVRQAQQTLGGCVMVLLLVLLGIGRLVPAEWVAGSTGDAGLNYLAVCGAAALALVDVAVVRLTTLRFRRDRLIDA